MFGYSQFQQGFPQYASAQTTYPSYGNQLGFRSPFQQQQYHPQFQTQPQPQYQQQYQQFQPQFRPQYQPQYQPQQQLQQYQQYPQQQQYLQPQPFYPPQIQRQAQFPNGYTSRVQYQTQPSQQQILTSPQKNIQLTSPPRQNSQQQIPQQQIPVQLQRPISQYAPPQAQKQQQKQAVQQQVPQAKTQKSSQKPQPQQNQSKAIVEEDLEKRFADAIQRTKNIVDQYQGDEAKAKKSPSNLKKVKEITQEQDSVEDLALQYEDGYIYRGQGIAPQTRHGFGIMSDSDENEVYAGFWQDNFYHGEGRLNNLQQENIEGNLDWNNMTAIANGWAGYEGEFQQGKMHGQGVLFLTNGEKFSGQFKEGMIDGSGEFTTSDGSSVKGIWEQGTLVSLQE